MSSSSSAMIVTMTAGNRKNEATAMAPMAARSTSHCRTPTQNPSPAQSRTQATRPSPAQSSANHEASQTVTKVTREYRRERLKTRRKAGRSEEHTSELQSLMRISYAVFCLKKKRHDNTIYSEQIATNR